MSKIENLDVNNNFNTYVVNSDPKENKLFIAAMQEILVDVLKEIPEETSLNRSDAQGLKALTPLAQQARKDDLVGPAKFHVRVVGEPEMGIPELDLRRPPKGEPEMGIPELDLRRPPKGEPEMGIPELDLRRPPKGEPEMGIPELDLRRPPVDEPEMAIPEVDLRRPSKKDA